MFEISGGRLLSADGRFTRQNILFDDTGIQAIGVSAIPRVRRIDAGDLLILPGAIDLHGDAFERQLMPRPGVHFATDLALLETDRQLIANGITTAYHGLTWSWEPGLRGSAAARDFVAALETLRPRLLCDNRVHLRFEVFNLDVEAEVSGWLESRRIDLLAFNNHIEAIAARADRPAKMAEYAGRSGLSIEDFLELLQRTLARREQVPAAMARLAEVARRCDIPLASHDDDSPEMTASMHRLGCRICEFPLDEATARHAIAGGAAVIMGGPNILRGGSHCGRLDAAAAIAGGLSNVLTSDYYYPAMLQSVFRLVADAVLPLQQAWPLISGNAAAAAGLYDRGVLAPGKRADLVLVDDSDPALPQVVATFAGGRPVYATRDLTGTG